MFEDVCAAIEKASMKKGAKVIEDAFSSLDYDNLKVRYLNSFNKFIITNLFWKDCNGNIYCPMVEILNVGSYIIPVPVLVGNISLKGYSSGRVEMFLEKNRYIPDEDEIENSIWHEPTMLTIDHIKEIVKPIAEKYGLEAVYLFGSQARGESTPESDYDFYIKRGNLRGLFELSGLFIDLKAALGKQVDIVLEPESKKELDDYLVEGIKKDGILIYSDKEMIAKLVINNDDSVNLSNG